MLERFKNRFVHFFAKIFAERTATVAVQEVTRVSKKISPEQGLVFLSIFGDFIGRPLSDKNQKAYRKAFNLSDENEAKEE